MAKKLNDSLERDEPKHPNQCISLILPTPISVNSMYVASTRRQVLTAKARQWFKTAQCIAIKEVEKQGWVMEKCSIWFSCEIKFYFNDKRFKDSHNYLKLMLDALEGIIYNNDYFVMPRIVCVELDRKRPRVELIIKPIDCKSGDD